MKDKIFIILVFLGAIFSLLALILHFFKTGGIYVLPIISCLFILDAVLNPDKYKIEKTKENTESDNGKKKENTESGYDKLFAYTSGLEIFMTKDEIILRIMNDLNKDQMSAIKLFNTMLKAEAIIEVDGSYLNLAKIPKSQK
jgi:MFS superfamily sulfate permease-like transporter